MAGEFGGGGGYSGGVGSGGGFGGYASLPGYFYKLFTKGDIFVNPLDIFKSFGQFFEGHPRKADTTAAVLRLGGSRNPVARKFGYQLGVLENAGVVLSSSDPAGRAALNKIFKSAMDGLEQQGFPKKQAFRMLTNVINSDTGTPGAAIPIAPRAQPVTPVQMLAPQRPVIMPGQRLPMFPTPGSGLDQFANQITGKAGKLIKDFVPGLREYEDLTGREVDFPNPQPIIEFFRPPDINRDMRRRLINQPLPQPQYPNIPIDPDKIPIIDPQDCPSCSGDRLRLQRQERDLQDEIQVEQQQDRQKRIEDRQKEIDRNRQLETQPPGQRDIGRELQDKQRLLRQVQSDIDSLRGGQPRQLPPPSGEPLQPNGPLAPQIDEPEPDEDDGHGHPPLFHQGDRPNPPKVENPVRFCVSCVSQNDAMRFLNGEPSQCSVEPETEFSQE